jgi:hypothetical protein
MPAPFWQLAVNAATPRDAQNALYLQPGVHVQVYDATLTSLAGLSVVQGNLLYGSAADTLALLAKDANATRYLSNTGASNNPAWAQVNLANGVTGTLPVANGGTGDTGTAWTTYTPTVTAGTGTFTSVAAAGRYKLLGKTCFFQITVTITTNGSASDFVKATLPGGVTPVVDAALCGNEMNTTFVSLSVTVFGGLTDIFFNGYDTTYPGSDGAVLCASGMFEIT